MMERFALTPKEAAAMLGVHVTTVYRAIKAGEIPTEIVSNRKLIPARALVEKFGEPVPVKVEAA